MEPDKLNALYLARYGTPIPCLADDIQRWTFQVKNFDEHLSLYRFRLSIWRDACIRKNYPDARLAQLDEYEKMLNELESSPCRDVIHHIISSATGSTHIYTDREGTTLITSCDFKEISDSSPA